MMKTTKAKQSKEIPILGLAETMKQMGAVLRGDISVPNEGPKSKMFYNDEAAKRWHEGTQKNIRETMTVEASSRQELAAFAKLFAQNGDLFKVLADEGAESIAALADRLGRAPSNVGRTLKKLEEYGIVYMEASGNKVKKPILAADEIDLKLDLRSGRIRVAM